MSASLPVQSPLLVGRDEQLDFADRCIADAADGHGRLLLLAGEAGIGKTRLMRAIRRRAVVAGFRDAGGDISPSDHDVPLAIFGDLARTMLEVPGLASLGDDLLARCARARTDAVYSRTLVLDLVDRITAAIDAPTLLTFEDLQWADDLSLEAIAELARVAERGPLLMLGSYRRDEAPPGAHLRDWRARLITQRRAEELRLARLTRDETATVTTLLLGGDLPAARDIVDAVHTRSDGLPLHIEELIAAVRAAGPVDATAIRSAAVPDTIEDAVLARIARRSPEAIAVARGASVMGRCFRPDVLAGVLDLPVGDLEGPLRELVDHAILFGFSTVDAGYYDFRHQLLREALYDSTPDRDRRRYHARAGEFGGQLDGATEVHASLHYERAGLTERAFRAALAGARGAVLISAHREAFELYRRAVANMPGDLPDLERGELYEHLSDEAAAIEENALSERMARAAADAYQAGGAPERALVVLGNVESVWRRMGHPLAERRALVTSTAAALEALPPTPARDEAIGWNLHDQLAIEIDSMALDAARTVGRSAGAAARASENAALESAVAARMAMVDILEGDVAHGLASMSTIAEQARAAGLEEVCVTAFRNVAVMAARALDYTAATQALAEGLVYADSVQQSHCAHVMAAVGAEVEWAAGRWDDAVACGDQAIVDRGCLRAQAMARWPTGYVAFGRGEIDRARAVLETSLAFGDRSELVEWRLPPRWGLAETAFAEGDPIAAVGWCEEASAIARAVGERAGLVPLIVTGVRAHLACGRPDEAERWVRACEEYLADTPAFGVAALQHARGLVALAIGSVGAARTELQAAVSGWDAVGRVWEASHARLDLATALARSNRFATAVALAVGVRELAQHLGSPALRDRADELIRQGRGRIVDEEPWRPLTAREFAVARLVAEGRTNAEIADELGIAPKTASSHIEHILAKLGASRRAEIAVWATSIERSSTPH